MVGKSMAAASRERLASLVSSAILAIDIPSKIESLRQLKVELLQEDPVLVTEFLPFLLEFLSDHLSPVRKFVTAMVGEIGLKNTELLSDTVPVLIDVLDDDTPAVVRQAILCGIDLFRSTFEKIAIRGLYSCDLDSALESSWAWMVRFKEKVYSLAFQHGSSGVKLLALKFVEAVIHLYTPDPNGSSEPPSHHHQGQIQNVGFNISWLRRGHPILNIRDLSVEASHNLGLLLDQLRFPTVKSLSNTVVIVVTKSLSAIAINRPTFYGRILPVLLSLEPSSSVVNGVCVSAVHLALKNAFLSCSKCTHPSTAPWRDRLAGASNKIHSEVFHLISPSIQREKDYEPVIKEEEPAVNSSDSGHIKLARKRSGSQDRCDLSVPGKRARTIVGLTNVVKSHVEEEIPATGVGSAVVHSGMNHSTDVQLEDADQEQVTSFDQRSSMNLVPSISTDKGLPSRLVSSTATSVVLPSRLVLPKMIAPVVYLADEQKDNLQVSCFMRIIDALKQIAETGGSKVRFSILGYLGVEFPLDLDPWKLLQKHILIDYTSHEGHELTLRVLYRLFAESQEETDFFSSTTAASVYEKFLLTVAEALRDSFPPSDKSLSKLLDESPYLPKSVLKMLESMCSPGNGDKSLNVNVNRVTQGLSAVWSLILLRPPIRDPCLKIALQSAVHHLEKVRMKAIRLVANKLYPLPFISQQIQDFAKEMMFSVMSGDAEAEEPSSDSDSVSEAQRCMSLYFALCTKKHSLFCQIFIIYRSLPKPAKQAVDRQIPILVRTMGSSSDLLQLISDPPNGSESLRMQVLNTLKGM